jgi:predicted  nucleic acid-binding Zn-ribbon protein
MRLAETKQYDALGASAALRDGCADLAVRRGAITSQLPLEALEDYERALRRGLAPAAVATRGKVCWGCFHPLSAAVAAEFLSSEAILCCPHCERVLFNPDWRGRP